MRILVTGGAGFIGSHTTVELQNAGYQVVNTCFGVFLGFTGGGGSFGDVDLLGSCFGSDGGAVGRLFGLSRGVVFAGREGQHKHSGKH